MKLRQLERGRRRVPQLYNSFLERYKETAEQQELIEADAKVVSTAAPPDKPSTPGPKLFGAVGFTASLMLGHPAGTAPGAARQRPAQRASRSSSPLGLPALGLVPRLERLKRKARSRTST